MYLTEILVGYPGRFCLLFFLDLRLNIQIQSIHFKKNKFLFVSFSQLGDLVSLLAVLHAFSKSFCTDFAPSSNWHSFSTHLERRVFIKFPCGLEAASLKASTLRLTIRKGADAKVYQHLCLTQHLSGS